MIPKEEYNPYFEKYIKLVKNDVTIVENMINAQAKFENILKDLPKEKQEFAYAEGKWTIKEVIQHIIDTERIFCYRALCFARNDKTDLPGFDQDDFVKFGNANALNYQDLLEEMRFLRKATITLFKSFSDEMLLNLGTASGNLISVRALGYLFSGHQLHHLNIVKERYL